MKEDIEMTHKLTGNQPQNVRQRIYGSTPVEPLADAPSDQPRVLQHTKVHGQRKTVTVRVRAKDTNQEMIITKADFDETLHERLD